MNARNLSVSATTKCMVDTLESARETLADFFIGGDYVAYCNYVAVYATGVTCQVSIAPVSLYTLNK